MISARAVLGQFSSAIRFVFAGTALLAFGTASRVPGEPLPCPVLASPT
jgi:hypothetical protein